MTATVKICGLKTPDIALAMRHLPVDQIGFVFAPSRRRITPEQAGNIIRTMRGLGIGFKTAGVFVNPTIGELDAVLRSAPLDMIQLSGQESPELILRMKEKFGLPVYKAFAVAASAERPFADWLAPYAGAIDAVLLDTYDPQGGGSGTAFAWDVIPAFKEAAAAAGIKLLVAGGLNADNVRRLLDEYAPDGVDVSSGVETDGEKDIAKITAFVKRVKEQ